MCNKDQEDKMKRKFFSLAIVLMLTVSVMFTVAGMSLFAAAQGDASMDATGSVSVSYVDGIVKGLCGLCFFQGRKIYKFIWR